MNATVHTLRPTNERQLLPDTLIAIRDEHSYVLRLFVVLGQEADLLAQGKPADYECIADILAYMSSYPDRFHHPKEELIFDRMSKADAQTQDAIARLRLGHEQIDDLVKDLSKTLASVKRSRSKKKRKDFAESLYVYIDGLKTHMALEEAEVFDPAAKLLSKADWAAIDKEINPVTDPVFGQKKLKKYAGLFSRYINSYQAVSLGGVPPHFSEKVMSTLERSIYAANEIRQLPGRFFGYNKKMLSSQFDRLQSLFMVRDFDAAADLIALMLKEHRNDTALLWRMVSDAFAAREFAFDDEETGAFSGDEDFISYGGNADGPARVSWQALVASVALRLTLKQLMGNMKMGYADKIKEMTGERKIPEGYSAEYVKGESFKGQWIRPEGLAPTSRTILFLPGGGFIFPAVSQHATILATLVGQTQSQGLMVDYRLAPDHPFPAGLEDAIAAYKYLLDQGIEPKNIVLAGDSAGGGLSLSLLIALRDEGLPMPVATTIISPLADLSYTGPSRAANRWRDPMLPTSRKIAAHKFYSVERSTKDPLISPVYGDLSGFPPLFIQVGSTEILLDDSVRIARKAREQGVDVHLEVWHSMPHDWHLMSFVPEAQEALSRISDFFNDQLAIAAVKPAKSSKKAAVK